MIKLLQAHGQAFMASLGRLWRVPLTSLMIVCVIGIALALPSGLMTLLRNLQVFSQGLNKGAQISLYLQMGTTADSAEDVVNQLKLMPQVDSAYYVSPQQGLAEFKQQSDFTTAFAELSDNPLPGVIVVTPSAAITTPLQMQELVDQLKVLPAVATSQLDMAWVKRLFAMLAIGRHFVIALAGLLGLGVLLIIGSTIHLAMQKYDKEVEIYKLVGATNAFVRRPFLYTGLWYGLLGSLVAWVLVAILIGWLSGPVRHLADLYASQFRLQSLDFSKGMHLLLTGAMLGLLGAFVAVKRYLQ